MQWVMVAIIGIAIFLGASNNGSNIKANSVVGPLCLVLVLAAIVFHSKNHH